MKRETKKLPALLLAAVMVSISLAGCSDKVVSSTGSVEPPVQTSSEVEYPDEFPSANVSLPAGEISSPSQPQSESEVASESSVESSSEAESSSSTAPVVSSSKAPAVSSSAVPQQSSSQEVAAPASSVAVAAMASSSISVVSSSQSEPIASEPEESEPEEQHTYNVSKARDTDEVRGIWISYLDFYTLAKGQSKSGFSSNINNAFDEISEYGLNTVFVQVRPFGDAMYPSDIFPWSYILTGDEGTDPGYDPLAIMVSSAKKHGLRIETWINPYRVLAIGSSRDLSSSNPAVKAIKAGKDTAIEYNGGIFYNPSSKTARSLITQGVVELIENYDIDGIHFDDYFYPTTDMSFDADYYNDYCSEGGSLSQADWRRENVNTLVRQVYSAVKNTDSSVLFGISPQANMSNNYNGQFADIEKWLSGSGYVDYICPQIYYGFSNNTLPYSSSLDQWNKMSKGSGVDLYVGLAVYKCGVTDKWAGSGKNEWVNCNTMLQDMVDEARDKSCYAGFLLYRYDSLFNPDSSVKSHISKERSNLQDIL